MIFEDKEKAKENLLDIGYFRLGFYWFPFELTYPRKDKRDHKLNPDTKVLFDTNLPEAISTSGPAGNLGARKTMLSGAYMVLQYILGRISLNRKKEMDRALYKAFDCIEYKEVKTIIRDNSGIDFNNLKNNRENICDLI